MTVWLGLILTAIAALLIPLVRLLWNAAIRQQSITDIQEQLLKSVENLIRDKDQVHKDIINQMADDRKATDRRLRWLEENVWNTQRRR